MGKSTPSEDPLELMRKLDEKKKLLEQAAKLNGNQSQDKKQTKEEKEKIRRANKKKKKKLRKKGLAENGDADSDDEEKQKYEAVPKPDMDPEVQVEYVEKDEYLLTGKYYEEFKHVFQAFSNQAQGQGNEQEEEEDEEAQNVDDDGEQDDEKVMSKKKRKMMKRLKVAQLKALVKRPDLVELWDTTAKDPIFLLQLKSYRNTVSVPKHWNQKRKFLQNKRGVLKPPFKLPEHIENTGITKLRDPFNDKEAGRNVRQKLKERMNPKLGKIDIDYEILHDAFFKNQKRPNLSCHGDVYFEGKEDDSKMKTYKPGKISEELRQALGITEFAPPPWIANMQRYGPPPSYPNLKIPGLNAPLADGTYLGYKNLDENGKPIYADGVYGRESYFHQPEHIDKSLWGELVEEEAEEEYEMPEYTENIETASQRPESEAKSGITSMIAGMETPDIELQKKNPSRFSNTQDVQNMNYATSGSDVPKPLYEVLEPVQKNVGQNIYGSSHGYVIPGQKDKEQGKDNSK